MNVSNYINKKVGWVLQGLIWISLAIYYSLPQHDWTLGVFQSADGSVVVPIIYGSIINAILFYGNAYYLMDAFLAKGKYLKYWSLIIGAYIGFTLLESALDLGWFVYFYNEISKSALEEIIVGNLFLNALFFVVPSMFYRFALDWVRLNNPLTKKSETASGATNNVISLKTGKTHYKILVNAIEFIESEGNNVNYHCLDETISMRDSLAKLQQELPNDIFVRCHKSFIVSKLHVKKIDYDYIYLSKQQVPIGRAYRENVNLILH